MQRLLALAVAAAVVGTAAAACDNTKYEDAFNRFGDCTIKATNELSALYMCDCYAFYHTLTSAADCLTSKATEIAKWQANCKNIKPPCKLVGTQERCTYTGNVKELTFISAAPPGLSPSSFWAVGASLLAGLFISMGGLFAH